MDYSFNKQVAILYGVEEATMVHNFVHWIEKNRANGKHFYKGTYWTYNSIKAFCEIFPFWTKRQIERILKSLIDKQAIISDEFNEMAYDRTRWYAIKDIMIFDYYGLQISKYYDLETISPNGEMETTKSGNGFPQTVEPIPYSKQDSKQDIDKSISNGEEPSAPAPQVFSSKQKCKMFVDQFNKVRGTKYKPLEKVCGQLNARLKEGYTSKDIFLALKNAMLDPYHVETNFKYLTPEFMTRADKIDKFINLTGGPAPERKLVQ